MAVYASITATMSNHIPSTHKKQSSAASFHLPSHRRQRPSSEWSASAIDSSPSVDSGFASSAASSATSYSFMSTAHESGDHSFSEKEMLTNRMSVNKQGFYTQPRDIPSAPPPSAPLPAIPSSLPPAVPLPKVPASLTNSSNPSIAYRFPNGPAVSTSPPFTLQEHDHRPSIGSSAGTISPNSDYAPHPYSLYSSSPSNHRKDSAISQYSGPPASRSYRSPSMPTQHYNDKLPASGQFEDARFDHMQQASRKKSFGSMASHRPSTSASSSRSRSASTPANEPYSPSSPSRSRQVPPPSPSSSKSVLTIALQKAQSAVLLDSANNVQAAVAAYTQSVKLLKEVMTRVEEGTGVWRAKELDRIAGLKDSIARNGMSEELLKELRKREEKLEKREKARLEEGRRLKVIHDTYEERIRMLAIMEADPSAALEESDNLPTSVTTSTSDENLKSRGLGSVTSIDSASSDQTIAAMPSTPSNLSPPDTGDSEVSLPLVEQRRRSRSLSASFPTAPAPTPARNNKYQLSVDVSPINLSMSPNFRAMASYSPAPAAQESLLPSEEARHPYAAFADASNGESDDELPQWPIGDAIDASGSKQPSLSIADELDEPRNSLDKRATLRPVSQHVEYASGRSSSDIPTPRPEIEQISNSPASTASTPPPPIPPKSASELSAVTYEPLHNTVSIEQPIASTSQNSKSLLVNTSTSQGTISQRRKSPLADLGNMYSALSGEQSNRTSEESNDFTRQHPKMSSTSSLSVGHGLPPRLRTVSQPDRSTPSFNEDFPQDLQMRANDPRSALDLRKASMPNPSFQHASESSSGYHSESSLTEGDSSVRSPSPNFFASTPDINAVGQSPTVSYFPRSRSPAFPSSPLNESMMLPLQDAMFTPVSPQRKPFQIMQRFRHSIASGCYLTPRLYAPKSVWEQAGIKLTAVETKVRMIELLITGLEALDKAGEPLLVARALDQPTHSKATGERFAKELDSFDGLLEGIQSTLAKKLGFVEATKGKKGSQSSFGAWSSKISRSLDRMTNVKGLDAPALYVDTLCRLFTDAQILDRHLLLLGGESTVYDLLPTQTRARIDQRLRRSSEFFGSVVCRFVLKDAATLLDKHVKRAAVATMD